jgi:CHAT domain-containing protein
VITMQAVEVIWLDLTDVDIETLLVQYKGDEVIGGYLPGLLNRGWLQQALSRVLPLLGERMMAPVAARLRALGLDQVVLIPAGRLALLPLHAVRYSLRGQETCFLDEFTVSYAPNARALAIAQHEVGQRCNEPHLVGVGNPLPHPHPLPVAQAELEEVATLFPGYRRQLLYAEAATKMACLTLIPEGTHLHFACHGCFDLDNALASRLEFSGAEPLTLQEMLAGAARPVRARLAVLSACQSAVSDFRRLPDEFISLPAGLLQAGVPGVLGTLWQVDDLSTALVMSKFYAYHLKGDTAVGVGPMPPALALRHAQQWLREVTAGELQAYCERLLHRASEGQRASREMAIQGMVRFTLEHPTVRPFVDSPYHWAPFVFVGV